MSAAPKRILTFVVFDEIEIHEDRVYWKGYVGRTLNRARLDGSERETLVEFEGQATSVAWTLPISRTETKIFTLLKRPIGAARRRALYDGKRWTELSDEEHQLFPGDYEAQVGQGAITWHSEENLAGSDRGVTMFRTAFKREVRAVAAGEPPRSTEHYRVKAGNYIGDRDDVIRLGD